MPSDITLTSALRTNLQTLQKTKGTTTVPRETVSVSEAAQDFCTHTLSTHASELSSQMEEIATSIKTLEQSSEEISELLGLVTNAELIALAAQSALDADENADIAKFDKALTDIIDKAKEINQNSNIFDEDMELDNVSLSSPASVADSINIIRDAIDEAQGLRTTVLDDFSDIQTRQDFTKGTIEALETGQKNINITTLNDEGANLMALQTRMTLSASSLSLASPTQEELLRLF